MYITITPQKLGANYSQSVADFVDYLEKENRLLGIEKDSKFFFNQKQDDISSEVVIKEMESQKWNPEGIELKIFIKSTPSYSYTF